MALEMVVSAEVVSLMYFLNFSFDLSDNALAISCKSSASASLASLASWLALAHLAARPVMAKRMMAALTVEMQPTMGGGEGERMRVV
jgi:hypothetical protein